MRKINTIAIHCAATRPGLDIGAKEIDQWHLRRGWAGIGYHWVIRRSGTVEQGRPEDKAGAHVAGHNAHSIGICLVGGLDDNGKPAANFTPEQLAALHRLVEELKSHYHIAEERIMGHRDFPGVKKDCPCFNVRHWRETGECKN